MKFAKLIPILLFALALYSCKKSSPEPKVPNSMTFNFQGKQDSIAAPYLVKIQGTDLVISGSSLIGPALDIHISNYKNGNNSVIGTDTFINFRTPDAGGTIYACYDGALYISTVTQTHITGSFAGTAFNTNGEDFALEKIPVKGTFDVDIPQ